MNHLKLIDVGVWASALFLFFIIFTEKSFIWVITNYQILATKQNIENSKTLVPSKRPSKAISVFYFLIFCILEDICYFERNFQMWAQCAAVVLGLRKDSTKVYAFF